MVDTLWDVQYTRTMLDTMRPFQAEAALTYMINTHADGDHFWDNQLVTQAEIITKIKIYFGQIDKIEFLFYYEVSPHSSTT